MDQYAAALGVLPKANPPPPGRPPPIPREVQASRDSDARKIMLQEFAAETDPIAKAAIGKELARSGGVPATSPAADPYAAALGIGEAPEPVKTEAPPSRPPEQPRPRESFGAFDDMSNFVGRAGANIGNAVYGGVKGLGTLAVTGDVDRAAEAARSAPIPSPEPTRVTAQMEGMLAKLQEPFTWLADKAQLGTEETGAAGSGVAGAIAKAGIENLPLLVGSGVRAKGPKALEEQFAVKQTAKAAERVEPTLKPSVEVREMNVAPANNSPTALAPQGPSPSVKQIKLEFSDAPPANAAPKQTPAEYRRRAEVLSSVGLENARKSALTGDAKAAATDLQTSKLDSTAGNLMRAQLDSEKSALGSHAEKLIRETGGTHGLDQSATYARGNTIVAPLDALKDYFDRRTSELYKAADERAQGVPTELDNFRKVLGDDSQMTNADRVHLRSAVNSYAKQLNLIDDAGKVFSNAQQAETMRKFLGENWSPSNGRFVGKLKEALDKDVMAAAGEDVYSQARSLWKEKADTLDNPNGIAKILDASGPEGINRAVSIEKIADTLTGMPVKQLSHVVDTLKNAPAEIQPMATQALSEVKAQFANKVHSIGTSQAGQWNAKGVSRYLNDNAERIKLVFAPEEIAAFKNLNDAGHILAKDQSYPGAAVQQHNLVRSGMAHGLQAAGAGVGGFVGGPAGAAVGGFLGNKTASALGEAASTRAAKGRLTPLSEVGKEPKK